MTDYPRKLVDDLENVTELPGPEERGLFADTDLANARRLVDRHGDDIRWTRERGWFAWDGIRWQPNARGEVFRRAKETARSIYSEIPGARHLLAEGTKAEQAMLRWAQRSQSKDRLKAMVELAESEEGIETSMEAFDADPWLLNVNNGTVDLRTGILRDHIREDYCTRLVPIDFDIDAKCPRWEQALSEWMGDPDMVAYLQRAVGYTLTGNTGEQCLFFTYGSGANGKSVFVETVQRILGEYGQTARTDSITADRSGGIPNDIAAMAGARMVCMNETEDGQRLKEALVKDMTGGDTMSARFLHREFFDFRPQFKLWIRGNHKLQVRGTDEGIWRRIHLIPFTVRIPAEKRDPGLLEALQGELSGILAWAVFGCLEWQTTGLRPPERVLEAVQEYRVEMDVLGQFIDEKVVVRRNAQVKASALFSAYRKWCDETGNNAVNQTRFGTAMAERGFNKEKQGTVVYLGLELAQREGWV